MPAKPAPAPAQKPWKARRKHVKLEQDGIGEWYIIIEDGNPIKATDVEVSLWLDLQETRRALQLARAEVA